MYDTVCDKCADEIKGDEANDCDNGEWQGCTLCNECYAELLASGKIKEDEK